MSPELSIENFHSKIENHVTKFSFATKCGKSLRSQKKNQDQYIIEPIFCGLRDVHLFGICDGHGANGKQVSYFIKVELPKTIAYLLDCFLVGNNYSQDPTSDEIITILTEAFEETNLKLYNSHFDIKLSGSTCVICFVFRAKCFIANVGDSRAVLVRDTGTVVAHALSCDHKPNLPEEQERILKCNGRIEPFQDSQGRPKGPPRVWLKHEQLPGLAMSRSMGDS